MGANKYFLKDWMFKASDSIEWLKAMVPGTVHTDLYRNKQIPAPFYGTNEKDLQWIDKKDWEYETTFKVTKEVIESDRMELVFNGLDTYADVFLNGLKIMTADNMFRSWKADVKEWINDGENTLRVYFHSPIHRGLDKLAQLSYNLPATNDVSEIGGLGDRKVSVFTRKAPYHFGWDWGPRFVTSGIWRDVYIEGWSNGRILDLFINQKQVNTQQAEITAVVEVEASHDFYATLELSTNGLIINREVNLTTGNNVIEIDAVINEPQLWWCNGLGEQHLYTFTATLLKGGQSISKRGVKTGLRSLRLVTDKDQVGKCFYFELNGVPVFAKGANHIPNDSFLPEVDVERYRYEVLCARESHMNMLRVWGGGIYEEDCFYDFCDEYGILVWQDFMFACSMYPGDEAFLENIKIEAKENIKRLRNHPSIALWCGNNEMDTAWSHYIENAGWGWKQQYTQEQREKIWQDYETIFHDILPEAVARYSPDTGYWPSSPMQGLTRNENQHATNQSTSGDIHYWGVWHNLEPFENYNVNIGRFMSEYGFQSFPEEKTVRTYAEDTDMELESEIMRSHQKNGQGNRLIKEYMKKYFHEAKDFPSFLYLSQVQQAEAIKMAIEAHRRKMPFTMGSLYWQINDCWPVASWSSMDYYGRWKALQYYAKRCFKGTILSVDGRNQKVDIYVVTDSQQDFQGKLVVELLDFRGHQLDSGEKEIAVKGRSASVVWTLNEEEVLGASQADQAFLVAKLISDDQIIDTKEHYFVLIKDIQLPIPNINVKLAETSGIIEWTLETDVLAKQVYLQSEIDGIFTDNFFDLIPGRTKKVFFKKKISGKSDFTFADPGQIIIKSMADFIE
jgi:beta-mannosidase